jgi:PAS domain S-box-containing protein
MKNGPVSKDTEIQELQNRIIDLKRQLAEAKDAILALTLSNGDRGQAIKGQEHERLLHESEERFSKAFQASPDALVISRMDDGRIIEINESFERLFGYSREEAIGKSSLELNMFADPTDRQAAIERIRERGCLRNFEIYIRTRSGEERPVNLSIEKIDLRDEAHLLTILHDLTERQQAEQALRASEARYRRVIEHANEGIWTIDADHKTDFINRRGAQILGYTVKEMLAKPAMDFVFPEDIPFSSQQLAERKQGIEAVLDIRMRHKEGHEVWVSSSSTPIFGEQGEYLGALAMFVDITKRKQAEEALRATLAALQEGERQQRELAQALTLDRGRLAAILENLPVGVWIADQNGQLIGKNAQADRIWAGDAPLLESIVQYPQDAVRFADSGKTLAPEEYPVARVLATGQPVEPVELCIDRFDGTEGTVLASAAPILDEKGQLMGVVSINLDITKSKLVEDALRENEAMLRLALTAGRAGAWKWDLTTGTMLWSDEYYRIFGFEPGSIEPSAEAGFSRIHPDDLSRIEGAVRQAVERGLPIDQVHRVIWPDGSVHWVRGISRAFYNEQGRPERMAGIAMDITEQRQAEIELQAAHRRNIEILESISDAFYSLDTEGRFTYVNQKAASLWGKQPGELLGKNIWEVFPSGKETESYSKIQQALTDRQPSQYESYSKFLDQWIEVHLYPAEQGISVYFQDISKRKRAEAALAELSGKLERSNRELEQFAFVASHDLQEPLRKIEAFGDTLLQSTEQADERVRFYVERMRNAAGRMRDMVNGLLHLSRINTQRQPFIRVELSKIAAEVLFDLEYQVRRTGGKVVIDELPVVEGDPLQLRQMLQNLIGNGLKYHRPGEPPLVKVYARQLPGHVQILVEDNGIGFDPKQVEQMFQPFQRLVGRMEYEGSGMGLAICRKIVERHDGEITAKVKPGEGSAFIVTLPIREESSE